MRIVITQLFRGSGYEFCEETTGHNKTSPEWSNDNCPICGKEWNLRDTIVVEPETGPVYHANCYDKK